MKQAFVFYINKLSAVSRGKSPKIGALQLAERNIRKTRLGRGDVITRFCNVTSYTQDTLALVLLKISGGQFENGYLLCGHNVTGTCYCLCNLSCTCHLNKPKILCCHGNNIEQMRIFTTILMTNYNKNQYNLSMFFFIIDCVQKEFQTLTT